MKSTNYDVHCVNILPSREVDFEDHKWMEGLDCVHWLALVLLVMNVKVLCCYNWIWQVFWFNLLIPSIFLITGTNLPFYLTFICHM